jgi:predicted KAP-like P-loop ATPase
MKSTYDLIMAVLPIIGALLIARAHLFGKPIKREKYMTLVGALLIFFPFIIDFYIKNIAGESSDYIRSFWIISITILVLGIPVAYLFPQIYKHLIKKKDKKVSPPIVRASTLLVDEPITAAEQDRLNRTEFANHFTQALLGHNDPSCLIAALYGPWGSGKSSLLNLIANHLSNSWTPTNDYIVIRFNPWNISSLDQLIAMFFHELKVAVQNKQMVGELKDNTIKLLDIFSGILAIGQLSPIGNQYFALGKEVTKYLSGTLKDIKNKSLPEVKKQLDDLLSQTTKRIYVLIDDIDRLDHKAMRLLFRMIRLNADFRNTTYILAFDQKIVEPMLDKEQPGHGKEYLDKIIQLPINIPSIDEAILIDILGEELKKIIGKYGEDKFDGKLWQELITSGRFFKFFKTIRDVVRYINGLRLNYALMVNEVNMVDFMALEAIRIFAADSYDLIRRNKNIMTKLTVRDHLVPNENIEETKKLLSQIFNPEQTVPEQSFEAGSRSGIVKDVCKVLFPQLARIYANFSYSFDVEQMWRQQKRICAKEMFDKYFILGVPKGEISNEEMLTILALSNNYMSLIEAINDLFDRKMGRRFLQLFEDYIDKVPPSSIEETIVALFDLEARIVSEPRAMLDMGADTQSARLVYLLLKIIDGKDRRKQIIINAMNRTNKIFSPVHFISLIVPHEDGKGNQEAAQQLGFSSEDLSELQNLCVEKLKMHAKANDLSKAPHLGMLLFRWLDWGVENDIREYIKKLIRTDEGIIDLLVGFSSEILSSDGSRRIGIRKQNINTFTDPKTFENIEEKVKKIKDTKWETLTELQKESVDAFLSGNELIDKI